MQPSMSSKAHSTYGPKASTRILIGFVALVLVLVFGYRFWSAQSVASKVFTPLAPSTVNIVGVDTSAGFRIIVSNGVAQVIDRAQSGEPFDPASGEDEGDEMGAPKKRVPIKEMLLSMQGDPEAIGRFVMVLNEMRDDDLPPVRVTWPKADIEKALGGDSKLKAKLERDLNTRLDGTPLPNFRRSTLNQGVVVEVPVTLEIRGSEGTKTVVGNVPIPYQTHFMRAVYEQIKRKTEINDAMLVGYYGSEAKKLLGNPKSKEDVAASLRNLVSDATIAKYSELPQRVLNGAKIVVNDSLIESASYKPYETAEGNLFRIDVRLSEEGRQRLWQYSRGKVGKQILLIVNGVAIAAPRIDHELAQRELSITQLRDERLAKDAVEGINDAGGTKAN